MVSPKPVSLVINLDRSKDRLSDMTEQFAACGVEFVRVGAVDARTLPSDVRQIHVSADPLREFDLATIACFLSHRKAWKTLAESGHDIGIIFEDDVVFGRNAGQFFENTDWFPDQTDIVKLETFDKVTVFATQPTFQSGPYGIHKMLSTHVGGAAYAMRRSLAEKLYAQTQRIEWPVDKLLFDTKCMLNSSLQVDQVVPAPFTQSFLMPGKKQISQSEIKTERDQYAPKGLTRFFVRQGRSIRKRFLLICRPLFNLSGKQVKKIPFDHPPLVPTLKGLS